MIRAAVIFSLIVFPIAGSILAFQFSEAELEVPKSDILFAHANHTDLECVDCHTQILESTSALDRNFPPMETCGECHDIEAEKDCGTCHRNPDEPEASPHPPRQILFSHKDHSNRGSDCTDCHGAVTSSFVSSSEHMPTMSQCFSCHDGVKAEKTCTVCHGDYLTLADIHPAEWRHQHGSQAVLKQDWCLQCHRETSSCIDCHRGDNLTGSIHQLNYIYTHGLDAKSKRFDCHQCHDDRTFCYACHERENRIPLMHSSLAWLTDHGRAARRDVESCSSCHDSDDPTCARSGCHRDADGIRGTDPRFHSSSLNLFRTKGPWHHDNGYYCFTCHTGPRRSPQGFCSYCHQYEEEED